MSGWFVLVYYILKMMMFHWLTDPYTPRKDFKFFLYAISLLFLAFMTVYYVLWLLWIRDGNMGIMMGIVEVISNNLEIVLSIGLPAILALVMFIENISIFSICYTYDIPFKLTYAKPRDMFKLFLEFIVAVGSVFLIILVSSGGISIPWLILATIPGIMYITISIMLKNNKILNWFLYKKGRKDPSNKRKGKSQAAPSILMFLFMAFISVIAGLSALWHILAVIFILFYSAVIFWLFIPKVSKRIFGDNYDEFTFSFENQKYIAIVRDKKDSWICVPVNILTISELKVLYTASYKKANIDDGIETIIKYKRSTALIIQQKDMKNIGTINRKTTSIRLLKDDEKSNLPMPQDSK